MGYRSEVVLAIAPEASSAFMALCAKNPQVLELCQNADQFVSGRDTNGDWFMYWSDIKWYDSFDDIGALNEFVMMLESDNLTDYGEPDHPIRHDGSPEQCFSASVRILTTPRTKAGASKMFISHALSTFSFTGQPLSL